jgi:hypothetical protein
MYVHGQYYLLGYGLDDWGIGVIVLVGSTISRLVLGLTLPPIQWISGAPSLGIKCMGHEADHLPWTSAKFKKPWIYTPTSPYIFMMQHFISYAQGELNTFFPSTISYPTVKMSTVSIWTNKSSGTYLLSIRQLYTFFPSPISFPIVKMSTVSIWTKTSSGTYSVLDGRSIFCTYLVKGKLSLCLI